MIALFGIAVLCGVLGIVVDEIIRSWDSRTSEEAERRAREREEALDRYWERYRRRQAARKGKEERVEGGAGE